MPKYRVNLIRVDNLSIDVEAEDEKSAIDAALEDAPAEPCAEYGLDLR